MMTRRTSSLLSLVPAVALLVAACAGTTPSAAPSTGPTPTSAPTGTAAPPKELKIALIPGLTGDAFYGTFQCGAEAAAKELGVTTTVQAADAWGVDLQQPILDAVLLQDPDGIVMVPHDFSALNPWIAARIADGIPVVTFDVIVEPNVATQGRATDSFLGGALAAKKLSEKVAKVGTAAAPIGSVAVVGINAGHGNSRRITGFLSGTFGGPGIIELRPDLKVLPTIWSENDAAKAASGVAAAIEANDDLVAVYTSNGTTAQGAASAIAAARKEDQIDLITWDLFPDFLADLKSGVVDGLVGQQPYQMGRQSVETLVGIIRGDLDPATLVRTIATPSIWVDQSNINDPEIVKQFYVAECS